MERETKRLILLRRKGEEELRSRIQNIDLGMDDRALAKQDALLREVFRIALRIEANLPVYPYEYKPSPELALEYYKTNIKGGDYEFVEHKMEMRVDLFHIHINFTARLKGTNSDPQLFFAELENGSPMEVTHCCKLEHTTYPEIPAGEIRPPELRMLHCDCVKCDSCAQEIITDEYGAEYF